MAYLTPNSKSLNEHNPFVIKRYKKKSKEFLKNFQKIRKSLNPARKFKITHFGFATLY